MDNKFPMVAKTFKGLEDVLRDELISLGAENVELGCRMVSFEGDLEMMYRANLCCRTALRILKPIEKFTAADPDALYDIVREIDWSKYMEADSTFAIDTTVNSGFFPHSQFVTYRVKDAIVDHFRDKEGKRPSVRVEGYDFLFNVHIDGDRITLSLDSSGEPLSKRGYRIEQTEAPINEVLAAGIIMKTGWRGDCDFADPMCGSGTFLIEAALIAANINPGIYRKHFAFEKWPDFDAELFEALYNDDSSEREPSHRILGGDIDPEAVQTARKNIKSAQVDDMVELSCRPMQDWQENGDEGVLVMNPPYGRRLKPDDMETLYRSIGTTLKRNFGGWHAWIIGLDNEDLDNIGLKPSLKIPMLNGSLECMLREYVMFSGTYDDFRAKGGRVTGFSDDREGPRRMKRQSDAEWKRDAGRFGTSDRKPKHTTAGRDKGFKDGGKPRKDYRERLSKGYRDMEGAPGGIAERPSSPARDFNREGRPYDRNDRNDSRSYGKPRPSAPRDGGAKPRGDWRGKGPASGKGPYKGRPGESRAQTGRDRQGVARVIPRDSQISPDKEITLNPVHFRSRKPKTEQGGD